MRIELSANELLRIACALDNESIRLFDEYSDSPRLSAEQNELFAKYLETSGLGRKVWEAYRKADRKERRTRSYPKAA